MQSAKIFINGRSQAVRLPKEYRFNDSDVYVKKVGDIVMLIPKDSAWTSLEASLSAFSDDYMSERNQPTNQERDVL